MKKKVIGIFLAVMLVLSFNGCSVNSENNYCLSDVKAGTIFKIGLKSYSDTTYSWSYEIYPTTGIEYISNEFISDGDNLDFMGEGELIYTFRAVTVGDYIIKFEVRNLVESSVSLPLKTNIYKLRINQNDGGILQSGQIFTLDEVYNAGEITFEDLRNIAYYSGNSIYNADKFENFIPKEKDELNDDISLALKKKLAEDYNQRVDEESHRLTTSDFMISAYYGCYKGFYAFRFKQTEEKDSTVITEDWEGIDGVRFRYTSNSRISMWKYEMEI